MRKGSRAPGHTLVLRVPRPLCTLCSHSPQGYLVLPISPAMVRTKPPNTWLLCYPNPPGLLPLLKSHCHRDWFFKDLCIPSFLIEASSVPISTAQNTSLLIWSCSSTGMRYGRRPHCFTSQRALISACFIQSLVIMLCQLLVISNLWQWPSSSPPSTHYSKARAVFSSVNPTLYPPLASLL